MQFPQLLEHASSFIIIDSTKSANTNNIKRYPTKSLIHNATSRTVNCRMQTQEGEHTCQGTDLPAQGNTSKTKYKLFYKDRPTKCVCKRAAFLSTNDCESAQRPANQHTIITRQQPQTKTQNNCVARRKMREGDGLHNLSASSLLSLVTSEHQPSETKHGVQEKGMAAAQFNFVS